MLGVFQQPFINSFKSINFMPHLLGLFSEKNMAIQTGNLGTEPSGTGGDTSRSFAIKMNENFTNNTHAASRLVGTATGNVMEVGAFGLGGNGVTTSSSTFLQLINSISKSCFFRCVNDSSVEIPPYAASIASIVGDTYSYIMPHYNSYEIDIVSGNSSGYYARKLLSSSNTTVDSNGFIKKASPIIKLFANKIESNTEAFEQESDFEKITIGHYLLKNTEGFSDNGWYIEMPKDANGNVLVAVQYQQLEDNTIEVKTFAKKFDEETGDIVPNLDKPRDIPAGRWIDIRLKELPQPEIEISNTPPDFQPTNIAKAVAEALKNDTEQ